METKNERFRRLAASRTNKAIASIRSLGNLSNATHYEYSQDEISKIFSALKRELDATRSLFHKSIDQHKPFKL